MECIRYVLRVFFRNALFQRFALHSFVFADLASAVAMWDVRQPRRNSVADLGSAKICSRFNLSFIADKFCSK